MSNNYFPEREKEIDIPSFLQKRESDYIDPKTLYDVQEGLNESLAKGEEDRMNSYHLKELDNVADNYTPEEARVIVKRLVSNYPEIVLDEVVELIKDMQELSMSIMKNSSMFAKKRSEV